MQILILGTQGSGQSTVLELLRLALETVGVTVHTDEKDLELHMMGCDDLTPANVQFVSEYIHHVLFNKRIDEAHARNEP